MQYFWHHQPEEGFPPEAIIDPSQFTAGPRLNVACTQTQLSPHAQRRLVDSWCDVLPSSRGIRFLWLSSRAPQKLFDAACSIPGLEGLYVKWSGIKTIEALRSTSAIQYFHLGSSTGLESIETLSELTQLRWLGLENLAKISNLQPLASLTNLEGLTLEGSMWRTQEVESLEPIGNLHRLKYLSIANLKSRDRTLAPLYPLESLAVFHAATWWKQEELEEIRRRNPCLQR